MTHRSAVLLVPLLALSLGLAPVPRGSGAPAGAPPSAPEQKLRERDHQELGELVRAYFTARDEQSGTLEALEDLRKAVEKLEKRMARDLGGSSLLSCVEDWEQAFALVREYELSGIRKGRVETKELRDPFENQALYAVHVPKAYNPRSGALPLVLSVPDENEKPEDHLNERWASGEVRDAAVIVVPRMPTNAKAWTVLGERGSPGGVGAIMTALGDALGTYYVDRDRIYLAGKGQLGVATAAHTAALYPHIFAAFVGFSGDVAEGLPAANFRNLPALFVGCGGNSTALVDQLKEAGVESASSLTTGGEAEAWAWMSALTRAANPTHVTFQPVARIGPQAYWIRADGFEPETAPRIDARIDRETNTIHVDAEHVTSLDVYFNDLLVDLDQPVKVVVNGTESEDLIPRDLQLTLELAYASGDSGRVYVNSKRYVVPAKPE